MCACCQVHQLETTGGSSREGPHHATNGTAGRVKADETPKEASGDDGAWPASLRRYLQRAFDKCDKSHGSRQHALLEKALHRKVTDAMADNEMLTKDWDNEPLPRCALLLRYVVGSFGLGVRRSCCLLEVQHMARGMLR